MKLGDIAVPQGAEERAWRVVSAAFGARIPAGRRRRARGLMPAVVVAGLAGALAISAAALSASVRNTVRDVIGVRSAAPLLLRLPAPGRLLVDSSSGPWIVGAGGARRQLGGSSRSQTAWSPHGLFEVTVAGGNELTALDPKGGVRWALARPAIRDPRWSGDGYRIAYRSGPALRVVAGDGSGDRLLARHVAAVAPAWEGATHELAYADPRGRIHVVDADTSAARWVSASGPVPVSLAWEPGAGGLVVVTRRSLHVLRAADGRVAGAVGLGGGRHLLAVSSRDVAAVTATGDRQGSILLVRLDGPGLVSRPVFHGSGSFGGVAWSPDGRWLLVAWPSADQWVFVGLGRRPGVAERVEAVASIAREFDSGTPPILAGWCCAAG